MVTAVDELISLTIPAEAAKRLVQNYEGINLDAGRSGTAGSIDIFPATAARGKLNFSAADSAGDTTTTITNASQSGARTYTIPDAGASASFAMTAGAQTLTGVQSWGTVATNALVGGAGASGAEHELGSTAGTALDFRFRGSHTTGDMRSMYLRLDLDAAAASAHGGEALRVLTEIENVDVAVGGTVNGAHITLEVDGNSGTVDGAGNAIRATLGGSGTKTMTGTLSGVLIDLDLPSAVTLAGTEAAIRIGKAQDHEWPVAIAFDSTVGSGNAIQASTSSIASGGATTHAIRVKIDGVDGFIPVFDAADWNP